MTKKERLEALIAYYSDGKPTKFAKFLGVAPSTISSWLKRDTYDHELLFAKCESISAEWLITGEGKMIIIHGETETKEVLWKLVESMKETIETQKETIDSLKEEILVLKGDIVVPHRSVATAYIQTA